MVVMDIRGKRNNYLINLIERYLSLGNDPSIFDCYEFVKSEFLYGENPFFMNLNEVEMRVYMFRPERWQIPLESVATFRIFLKNNDLLRRFSNTEAD
jgi:hypothetical protein